MKHSLKQKSPTEVELTVTLTSDEITSHTDEAVEQLSENLKISGFRKGKVPASVAKKNIDPNTLSSTILDLAVRASLPDALAEAKVMPLVAPEVSVSKYVPDETLEYVVKVEIIPEIKLGKYKSLKVKREAKKITDKDVDEALENVRKSFAEKKVVDRAAKMGDEVVIDFTGKKDGVAFDGGTAKSHKLELGSHQFIPGFEEGIVGHKVGEEFDVPLTFPKEYHSKELAGAKVVFTVLIKQVNENVLPKLDEAFAAQCGNFKSIAELKDDIRKNLEAQANHKSSEAYKDALVEALVDSSDIPTPEVLVGDHMRNIRAEIDSNLQHNRMTFEDFLAMNKHTEAEWEAEARRMAERRVKAALALTEIAKIEKLAASEEETETKVNELRDVYKNNTEAIKQLDNPRVKLDIRQRLTIEHAIDKLVELNSK